MFTMLAAFADKSITLTKNKMIRVLLFVFSQRMHAMGYRVTWPSKNGENIMPVPIIIIIIMIIIIIITLFQDDNISGANASITWSSVIIFIMRENVTYLQYIQSR